MLTFCHTESENTFCRPQNVRVVETYILQRSGCCSSSTITFFIFLSTGKILQPYVVKTQCDAVPLSHAASEERTLELNRFSILWRFFNTRKSHPSCRAVRGLSLSLFYASHHLYSMTLKGMMGDIPLQFFTIKMHAWRRSRKMSNVCLTLRTKLPQSLIY